MLYLTPDIRHRALNCLWWRETCCPLITTINPCHWIESRRAPVWMLFLCHHSAVLTYIRRGPTKENQLTVSRQLHLYRSDPTIFQFLLEEVWVPFTFDDLVETAPLKPIFLDMCIHLSYHWSNYTNLTEYAIMSDNLAITNWIAIPICELHHCANPLALNRCRWAIRYNLPLCLITHCHIHLDCYPICNLCHCANPLRVTSLIAACGPKIWVVSKQS